MAFYQVIFEGNTYVSRDMYMCVFGVGGAGLMKKQNSKLILNTVVHGPLSAEELKQCSKYTAIHQDFDAQTSLFVKANGTEQEIKVVIEPGDIIKYRNRRYVRLTAIKDDRKYRLLDRLAIVRVCGRNIYVVLDVKNKDVSNPVVITEKTR